jgi:succinate dehydrogenase/fumarate reductase flavoprotein subunit
MTWDRSTDIIVVGFGAAGGVAAIEAADCGAEVLVLEKMPDPGGLSAVSAGGARVCNDVEECYKYLLATSGGRTPDNIMRGLAEGMFQIPAYLQKLADAVGAKMKVTPALGNYPFPGYESLAYCQIDSVPALEGLTS